MHLPLCHSRRELPKEDCFFCTHPNVHANNHRVTPEICQICHFWKQPPPSNPRLFSNKQVTSFQHTNSCYFLGESLGLRECSSCRGSVKLKVFDCAHPKYQDTTVRQCQKCQDHQAPLTESTVNSWGVAITTAPRLKSTLETTLNSLQNAGWSQPYIFAEPESSIPAWADQGYVTKRDTRLGGWRNWYQSLLDLVQRVPDADAYLLVQDDAVFCRNIRLFLEKNLWPASNAGVLSLYCPTNYTCSQMGWHPIESLDDLKAAVTFLFPRQVIPLLLSDPELQQVKNTALKSHNAHIDMRIGQWAQRHGLSVWYFSPSLVQHIGDTSTLWPGAAVRGVRHAPNFVGEDFDVYSALSPHK